MDLLPPGIPKVDAEEILPELVAYLHDEQTAYGRDVIAWYIEHNDEVATAFDELVGLATLFAHIPAVTPSRKFVRRVVKELPRLKAQGRIARRLETSVLRVHWTIEDWVVYTGEYVAYRLKQHPAQMLASAAALLLLIGGALLLPLGLSSPAPEVLAVDGPVLPDPNVAGGEWAKPRTPDEPRTVIPLPESVVVSPEPESPDETPQPSSPDEVVESDPLPPRWTPPVAVPPSESEELRQAIQEAAARREPIERDEPQVLPGESQTDIPNPFRMRDRDDRIRGVSRDMREALDLGVGWLIGAQWPDGAWRVEPAEPNDTVDSSRPVDARTLQLTAQACLALLGEGYSSRMQVPERGMPRAVRLRLLAGRRAVAAGLQFLLNRQREDGAFLPVERRDLDGRIVWPSDAVSVHAQATLALLEDYVQCDNWRLRPMLLEAVDWLLQNRHLDGGWGRTPADDRARLEPTFWAVVTLKVAQLFMAMSDPQFTFDRVFTPAEHFLAACTRTEAAAALGPEIEPSPYVADTAMFDFDRGPLRPTALGLALGYVLDREFVAGDRLAQAETLLADPPQRDSVYGFDPIYAFAGAMAHASSRPDAQVRRVLDDWQEAMVTDLLAAQVRTESTETDDAARWVGSWTPVAPYHTMGNVRATALAVLTLQNTYRFRWDAD